MYITCKRGTRGTFNITNRPTCDTVLNNYHLFIIFCGLLSVLGLCTAPSLDMKSENSILTSQFAMTLVVDNLFHELKRFCLLGSRHVRDTFDDVRLNVLNFFINVLTSLITCCSWHYVLTAKLHLLVISLHCMQGIEYGLLLQTSRRSAVCIGVPYVCWTNGDAENARHENARNAIVWNTECCPYVHCRAGMHE